MKLKNSGEPKRMSGMTEWKAEEVKGANEASEMLLYEPAAQFENVFAALQSGLLSAHRPFLAVNTLCRCNYKGCRMTHFHTQRQKGSDIIG